MTTQVQTKDIKQPTLSEKALRLLAAHDREIKGYESSTMPNRTVRHAA